jgi:hypothetical protein
MLHTKLQIIWPSGFRGEEFLKSANQKQESPQINRNLVGSIYGRSSIKIAHSVPYPLTNMVTTGDSCFWLVYFQNTSPLKPHGQMIRNLVGSIYQRKSCFRNQTIRNKNCLWRPCLLTDQNGMNNSHRGPSIDASYQGSFYLAKLEIAHFVLIH